MTATPAPSPARAAETNRPARQGLSAAEAARRLASLGPNRLERAASTPPWRVLLAQLRNPMVALLLGAAALAGALGEGADAIAIGVIVLLNTVVGSVQELRAEKAILALRALSAPRARVIRGGVSAQIASEEVVPGDLLVLEAGDVVAADAQLLESHALTTVEAALTGESLPVEKSARPAAPDAPEGRIPLAERRDAVFAGTSVASGAALAEVRATGMATELGRIAALLQSATVEETPLQARLRQVSGQLLRLCLGVVAAVAVALLLRGVAGLEVLLIAISLAVAAVPEGLPAVVTIALAVGVQRMAARHVLVRRLPAVETLGCTTVICTDKTGTLTAGQMAARELWGEDRAELLYAAAACCDAEIRPDGGAVGDPTEVALLRAAAERGIHRSTIEGNNPRVSVNPFDSIRRRMSVQRADGRLYVKGAASSVLPLCLSGTAGAEAADQDMAAQGLRVLAVAMGEGPAEAELRFVGLVGMADPPRPEAVAAVAAARQAGIRTVMITGDHPVTARAIAREMGIARPGEDATEAVHARATPEDKIAIVRRWKERGAIVAMTGDGVNDAPAVREAHVGIAMGKAGTEVTREAAAVVLTDDNFASIVEGVREGRAIYENIRKTVVYLLAGNGAELAVMLGAALLGLPLPLAPLHLLWINLVTDGLPALALVMDPPDPDAMRRPPRDPAEPLLGARQRRWIAASAAVEAAVVLGVFAWALPLGVETARTLAFSTLVASELLRTFAARSPDRTLWEVGAFTNLKLIFVLALSGALQLSLLLWEPARALMGLQALSAGQLLVPALAGLAPVTALEVSKLARRRGPGSLLA